MSRKTLNEKEQMLFAAAAACGLAFFQLYNQQAELAKEVKTHVESCAKATESFKRILIGVAIVVLAQLILAHGHVDFGSIKQ